MPKSLKKNECVVPVSVRINTVKAEVERISQQSYQEGFDAGYECAQADMYVRIQTGFGKMAKPKAKRK